MGEREKVRKREKAVGKSIGETEEKNKEKERKKVWENDRER